MRKLSGATPISSTIGAVFGSLWGVIAAMALPSAWTTIAFAAVAIVSAVVIAALWTARAPTERRNRLFSRKPYQVAVVLEVAAIYAASLILGRAGLQPYFIQVVGVIVGLHFIGLWIASGSRRFIDLAIGMRQERHSRPLAGPARKRARWWRDGCRSGFRMRHAVAHWVR